MVLRLDTLVLYLSLGLPLLIEKQLLIRRPKVLFHVLSYPSRQELAYFLRKALFLTKAYCGLHWIRIFGHYNLAEDALSEVDFDRKRWFLHYLYIVDVNVLEYLRLRHFGPVSDGSYLIRTGWEQSLLILLGPQILIESVEGQGLLLIRHLLYSLPLIFAASKGLEIIFNTYD